MAALVTIVALCAGCTGFGLAALAPFGLFDERSAGERIPVAFASGMGLFGWLMFWPGIAGAMNIHVAAGLCLAGTLSGLTAWRRSGRAATAAVAEPGGRWTALLLAAIVVVLAQDVIEGLAPPADADSLAYHFALAKQFAADGTVTFVPRAVTGAIPLLLHMTYSAALVLGGETALTMWTMVSGWMAAWLLYVLARRHLPRDWALAGSLLLLTTPAMLYGAGTGQVEARIASFVLLGAMSAASAVRTGRGADAAMAGAMAGFYAASKYMGLLFVAVTGIAMLFGRARWRQALLFGTAAALAGFQWYVWNWIHTGDPFFPTLFHLLALPDGAIWNAAHDAFFRTNYFMSETPIARDMVSFFTFPITMLVAPPEAIDGGRTGLGPLLLVAAPFVAGGMWLYRRRMRTSPLVIAGLIAIGFYALWFWSGTSQRIRHLLPIYPVVLLCLLVLAQRLAASIDAIRILAAAIIITTATQMAGQALQTHNYLPVAIGRESRDAFLLRNANYYPAARWVNSHLQPGNKVLTARNELIYQIDRPVYHAHPVIQTLVDLSPAAADSRRFLDQIRTLGITVIIRTQSLSPDGSLMPDSPANPLGRFMDALLRDGCVEEIKVVTMPEFASRTLSALGTSAPGSVRGTIYRLRRSVCANEK